MLMSCVGDRFDVVTVSHSRSQING